MDIATKREQRLESIDAFGPVRPGFRLEGPTGGELVIQSGRNVAGKLFQSGFGLPIDSVVVTFRDSDLDATHHRSTQLIAPRAAISHQ